MMMARKMQRYVGGNTKIWSKKFMNPKRSIVVKFFLFLVKCLPYVNIVSSLVTKLKMQVSQLLLTKIFFKPY
jgi:hypothetical protein